MLKQVCPNMTRANKYIANIIKSYKEDEDIHNQYIIELIEYHPTKKLCIDDIEWLKMKNRQPFNQLALFYKNKHTQEIDDISWKMCIRNYYGKYNVENNKLTNIILAFRHEIHKGTKSKYYLENTYKIFGERFGNCVRCQCATTSINVDHYPLPFKAILESFIKKNNIKLENVETFENEKCEINFKNEELGNQWLKYHDEKASFRILCSSCNSSLGSYGF